MCIRDRRGDPPLPRGFPAVAARLKLRGGVAKVRASAAWALKFTRLLLTVDLMPVRVNLIPREDGLLSPCSWTCSSEIYTKLAELIIQMNAEIAALRSGNATEYPDGVSPKKKQLAAYLRENPGVSNKSYIARQLGMDVTTVRKYYDEVRTELAGLDVS